MTKTEAIEMLDVFDDEGEDGEVGRRIVHSFTLNGMGADWDLAAVEEFIGESDFRGESNPMMVGMKHALTVKSGGRYIAFATKPAGEGAPS